MRHISPLLVILALSACGSGGSDGHTEPRIAAKSVDTDATLSALAAKEPLPAFPLGAPTFIDPPLNQAGVIVDAKHANAENPTLIARYAIRLYTQYIADPSRSDYLQSALAQTEWLATNLDCRDGVGVWRYPFAAGFGAEPGWASSLGNAHGIVALLMFARSAPDPARYIEAADCALHAFGTDVSAGGLATTVGNGLWYEEYATSQRSGILNGHIFALAGLYYTCHTTGWQESCRYLDSGMLALKTQLPQYDKGFFSNYSLVEGNYASPAYHDLHIDMLLWAYHVSGDEYFRTYAELFQDYAAGAFDAPETLIDGLMWYRSEIYAAPLEITAAFNEPVTAHGISIFFAGDPVPVSYSTGGPFLLIEPSVTARHTTGSYHTTAAVYSIPPAETDRVTLRFDVPQSSGAIELREIDVYHSPSVDERYNQLIRRLRISGWD